MKYVGGKQAIAKELVQLFGRLDCPYWEPFVGAASVIEKVSAPVRWGTDIDPHIIGWLRQTQAGWKPPITISEEQYQAARMLQPQSEEEFAYKAFVGYGCSFGAKWFGGYARCKTGARNYAQEAHNSAVKQSPKLQGIEFAVLDFFTQCPTPNGLIYCDPPYAGTTKVGSSSKFDSVRFWDRCAELTKTHRVLVTEFQAPQGWVPIHRWEIRDGLRKGNGVGHSMTETLWAIPELTHFSA